MIILLVEFGTDNCNSLFIMNIHTCMYSYQRFDHNTRILLERTTRTSFARKVC